MIRFPHRLCFPAVLISLTSALLVPGLGGRAQQPTAAPLVSTSPAPASPAPTSDLKDGQSSPAFVPPLQPKMVPPAEIKPPEPMKLMPKLSAGPAQKPSGESPLPEMIADPSDSSGNKMVIAHAKESFSEITLKDSVLVAQPPLLGSRDVQPDFIRELWQVKWRPNDPIDLYVIRPVGVKKPPVVLYLYGFPSETDRFKDPRYCKRVVQNGSAAVGFVSALTGHRYQFRPFKNWFVSELPESLSTTAHDVQMILNFLETQNDLDMDRVGIFGQGSGATIAALAAAADPRIKAVDLLDPWGDWPEWFAKSDSFPEEQRATYRKPEFLQKLEPLDPLQYLPRLQGHSLRMQFVKDSLEPEEAVKKLEAAAPPSATIKHYPTGRAMYAVTSDGRLFEWIAQELKARPGTKAKNDAEPLGTAAPALPRP